VSFGGRAISGLPPHEASQLVGMVFQNPNLQLITQTVQSEVAFGPENLALPCDLGIAKPAPEPFLIACERLGVSSDRTLMVGNNRLADSGSNCVGCRCLILPPVPPGATRGLRAAVAAAGIEWAQ
jgi:hypothetical protein